MTVRMKLYNKEKTFYKTYKDDSGQYRWQLYFIDATGEEDVIGASHRGWPNKEQAEYNAKYILASQWDSE